MPWFSISSVFHPAPTPNSKRPPDRKSRLATSLAVTIGSRWMTRQMPVPMRRRRVAAAAAVKATKGSRVWAYSFGRSPPPGNGVRRLVGMWVCSGTQNDSKPRSSRARASSSTRMAYSVGNMKAPMCMLAPLQRS